MNPGIYPNLSFADYCAIDAVNQSLLRPFIKSIRHGVYAVENRTPPSEAMRFGTAIHTLILDGEAAFESQYAIGGPINERTGECYGRNTKAFAEWLATQGDGREFLTTEEYARLLAIRDRLTNHAYAGPLIQSEGAARELTIVWDEPVNGTPVRCKARIDWHHPTVGILDLKSTADADPLAFGKSVANYGYHMQAAWYLLGCERVGLAAPRYGWIAVESAAPYGVGMYALSAWEQQCGLTRAIKALRRYADWSRGLVTPDDEDAGFTDLQIPGWSWEDEKDMEQTLKGYL